MTQVWCDYCKKRIREVAYKITAVDPERLDQPPLSTTWLHWECIAMWGPGRRE